MAYCVNCGGLIPNISEYHTTNCDTWCKCGKMEYPKPPPAPKDQYLTVGGNHWSTDEQEIALELVDLLKGMNIVAKVIDNPRGGKKYCLLMVEHKQYKFLGAPNEAVKEFVLKHR